MTPLALPSKLPQVSPKVAHATAESKPSQLEQEPKHSEPQPPAAEVMERTEMETVVHVEHAREVYEEPGCGGGCFAVCNGFVDRTETLKTQGQQYLFQ